MWIYYILILLSVVMFGGGFALQDLYRKNRGSSIKISMESSCIGSLAGFFVLLAIGGFKIEYTDFTVLMALFATLNGMAFTFFTFKALDYINLSLFSVFTMLGGMVLPFLQGIFFFGEKITLGKVICVALITLALICTVKRGEEKSGTVFYIGIFILNGMNGVISKLFTASNLPKTSAAVYSIWIALLSAVLSGAVWLILYLLDKRSASKDFSNQTPKTLIISYGSAVSYGVVNKVANFLLVVALAFVDTSVQYPLVTGGTMIVSTIISAFGEKKPSKRELLSVAISFIAMLALFIIPI